MEHDAAGSTPLAGESYVGLEATVGRILSPDKRGEKVFRFLKTRLKILVTSMQFKNGLALFVRTNTKRSWNLISFHSPHSLTWLFIVSFSLFRGDEAKVFPLYHGHRSNVGLQGFIRIPFVGILQLHRQNPMYYRDMWRRRRDREDSERYARSSMDYTASKPNVVDGGHTLQ